MIPARIRMRLGGALRRIRQIRGREVPPDRPVAGAPYDPSCRARHLMDLADPELAFSSHPGGADDKWQETARARLRVLLGTEGPSEKLRAVLGVEGGERTGFRRREVTLLAPGERVLPIQIVDRPAQEPGERRPAIICLQGTNSGFHLSWGEARLPYDAVRIERGGDYARQAAAEGFVAVALEQSCFGQRQETLLPSRSQDPCIDHALHLALTGRTMLGERAGDVIDVRAWLSQNAGRYEVDPERIYVMGQSSGGATALYALALDTKLAGGIVAGSVGRIRNTIGARGTGSGQNVVPGILKVFETEDVVALIAPRPLVVVSGTDDHIYPYAGARDVVDRARSAWTSRNSDERLTVVGPEGPHRFYPGESWAAFRQCASLD